MEDNKTGPHFEWLEVELRDLETLLRGKFGDSLIVDGFTTKSLLPMGENYGSSMFRVNADVRREGLESDPEKMFFIAKMLPPTEFQRILFESPFTFRKEIHLLNDIVLAYQALELEYGIPEAEVFDATPKVYGSRLSLEEGEDKFDENAVILMEDLKLKNYTCGDRKVGVDLPHARSLVKTLARFHALGVALKIKKPELFEELKVSAKPITAAEEFTVGMDKFLLTNMKKVPSLLPHVDRIEKAMPSCNSNYLLRAPVEPWGTIIHADLWVNNVMFRDDASGNPEAVKLVDFQTYAYQNPMFDLIFFLFTSCNVEVRNGAIEELIDLYYESFVSHLQRLECNLESFSRNDFNEQLACAANLEYSHCLFMLRVITMDSETDPAAQAQPNDMFEIDPPEEYRKRLAEITLKFLEENWI